jgi:threonine/homoserine/homoserine lactone efflux protein
VSTAPRSWAAGLYWIGVAMTVACLALVVAGNTELLSRFEHTAFPLSWAFAGGAVLAFVAFELCDSARSLPREVEERSQLSPEWEAVEL